MEKQEEKNYRKTSLYLKFHNPNKIKDKVDEAIKHIKEFKEKQKKAFEKGQLESFEPMTDEEIEKEAIKMAGNSSQQLRRLLQSPLSNFIVENLKLLTKQGQDIFVNEKVFDYIVSTYPLNLKGSVAIPIWESSDSLICTIKVVRKSDLVEMFEKGELTEDEYKKRLKDFEYD